MEREKWTVEKLPKGYPNCKRKDLRNAIEDLTNDLINKSISDGKDFTNQGRARRSLTFIQIGHSELQGKNNTYVLIASIISLFIALVAIGISLWTSSQ